MAPRRPQLKQISVLLSPELSDRIKAYNEALGIGGTYQDSVRDLLATALDSANIWDTLLIAAQRRAFSSTQKQMFSRLGKVFEALYLELQDSVSNGTALMAFDMPGQPPSQHATANDYASGDPR